MRNWCAGPSTNILGNVAAHTPEGSTATLTANERDGFVLVAVSDDGPGVPPDQLARIFDRFYRAGVPSRRPGSGLGLAVAAAVAAAHDGNVSAALNEPHGLQVTLTLPATSQHLAHPRASPRRPAETYRTVRAPAVYR
jgi:signal transduction histidine kinase